jgi:hypothetical protein
LITCSCACRTIKDVLSETGSRQLSDFLQQRWENFSGDIQRRRRKRIEEEGNGNVKVDLIRHSCNIPASEFI